MKTIFPLFPNISWQTYWRHLRHYGIAVFIFLIGLFLSLAAFRFYQAQDTNRTHAEFDRLADLRLFLINDILLETLDQMEYIKQFFYASTEVTGKDFSIFVRSIFNLYPNFLVLGWIEANSTASSALQPSVGLNFINSHENEKANDPFIPFTYLEEIHENQPLFIDSNDYAIFLDLLKKSQNSLETTVSDSVIYIQQAKKLGFFLFKPIFSENIESVHPQTGLFGTIVGFSNFEDILENVRARVEPIGINISI